jgi:hypothetical protein
MKYKSLFKKKDRARVRSTGEIVVLLWNVNEGNASQEHFPPRWGTRPVEDSKWDGRALFYSEDDLDPIRLK